MRQRFVPPSYQCDLRKKLQRLDQGDMSVQDYYAELQKGMIREGVHEETEDKICHFYGGLRTEIQDLIDYKEYNTGNHFVPACYVSRKGIVGPPTDEIQELFRTSYTGDDPIHHLLDLTPRQHLRQHVHLPQQRHHQPHVPQG
jgi:hypothetical protein